MQLKIYLIALLVLLLSSCAKPTTTITVDTKPVKTQIQTVPAPAPVVMNNITWKVLSIENSIYFGLSVADYEALALNMQELKKYILAQQNIISYYEHAVQ